MLKSATSVQPVPFQSSVLVEKPGVSPPAYKAAVDESPMPALTALAYGGATPAISPNYLARTEDWNGASWVEVADLSTGRSGGGGAGADVDSGLYFGGSDGSTYQTATEEWSGSSTTSKVLTD